MGRATYADLKGDLEEALGALGDLAEERDSRAVADGARSLRKKLAEERFNAVVVGEFKRGKTTLVNALLGEEVLPAGVVPLTSVVTAVTWGEEPRAEVRYLDGRVERVAPGELARFVTERENPANRLRIDRAVLCWPAEDLRDGVFLVDTPGAGSVFRHNTDAARAFLPEADVAIFLLAADAPVSEAELAFLREVREHAPRMFFVLNKVDHLREAEREEALAFTRGVLSEVLGGTVPVYPVSARQALEARRAADGEALAASGLAAFERDFRAFLLADRGRTVLQSVAGQGRKLVADELNSLEVEEGALSIPAEELARRAEAMERAFEEAARSRADIHALLEHEVRALVALVEEDLAALRRQAVPALLAEAEGFLAEHEDPGRAAEELDRRVKESLRRSVDRWRGEEERRLAEAFQARTGRFVEGINRLVRRTVAVCAELLQVDLSTVAAPAGIAPVSRFTYAFFEVPTILESLLPDGRRFLPRELARRRLLAEARRRVPLLVDRHCGRLRSDLVRRLQQARLALQVELDGRLATTVEGLRRGIRRAAEERARTAARVRADRERTQRLRERLRAIDGRLAPVDVRAGEGGGARGDVRAPDPLAGLEDELDPDGVTGTTVTVPLPGGAPAGDAEARYLLSLGLFDMLADGLVDACEGEAEAVDRLARVLRRAVSIEPVLRYDLFEGDRRAEADERTARVRTREVAVAREWLIPRLEAHIAACRERARALRGFLGEGG